LPNGIPTARSRVTPSAHIIRYVPHLRPCGGVLRSESQEGGMLACDRNCCPAPPGIEAKSGPWRLAPGGALPSGSCRAVRAALDKLTETVYTRVCSPGCGPACPGACCILRVRAWIDALLGTLLVLSFESTVPWPILIPAWAFYIAPVRQPVHRSSTAWGHPLEDVRISEEADSYLGGGDRQARSSHPVRIGHSTSVLAIAWEASPMK
jgi:hypothetical protein